MNHMYATSERAFHAIPAPEIYNPRYNYEKNYYCFVRI